MRIKALYDKNGNIIAASIPQPQSANLNIAETSIQAGKDQFVSEIEVPDDLTGKSGFDILNKLKVEAKGDNYTLTFKK
jgi:hypothetical protein